MRNEVYSFALKNTLKEIRRVCPNVANTFLFREDGEILVNDENTPEKTIVQVVAAFDGLLEKADTVGRVKCIILEGSKGRIEVSRVNDLYLGMVISRKEDVNHTNTVARVLVPTVLRLLEKIHPAPVKSQSLAPETEPEFSTVKKSEEPVEEPEETLTEEAEETTETEIEGKPLLPEPPVNQLIVENIGGFFAPSDIVRIDTEVLLQWKELFSDCKIEEVEIETFDGRTTQCKVKPIKDSKYEGKGVIQIPQKIQLTLEIKKGKLVRVKPIVEP